MCFQLVQEIKFICEQKLNSTKYSSFVRLNLMNLFSNYKRFFLFLQEIESLKRDLESMSAEMKSQAEKFRREKQDLVRQKDAERKRSVEEVQDQCERDYKQFTSDHHDTLTLALKTAREQHTREKVNTEMDVSLCLSLPLSCSLSLSLSLLICLLFSLSFCLR